MQLRVDQAPVDAAGHNGQIVRPMRIAQRVYIGIPQDRKTMTARREVIAVGMIADVHIAVRFPTLTADDRKQLAACFVRPMFTGDKDLRKGRISAFLQQMRDLFCGQIHV